MPKKLSVRDMELGDKKVLMRVDFNVPLDENQNIVIAAYRAAHYVS